MLSYFACTDANLIPALPTGSSYFDTVERHFADTNFERNANSSEIHCDWALFPQEFEISLGFRQFRIRISRPARRRQPQARRGSVSLGIAFVSQQRRPVHARSIHSSATSDQIRIVPSADSRTPSSASGRLETVEEGARSAATSGGPGRGLGDAARARDRTAGAVAGTRAYRRATSGGPVRDTAGAGARLDTIASVRPQPPERRRSASSRANRPRRPCSPARCGSYRSRCTR